MKIELKTVTPVHVGSGDDLYALDYVVYQSTFYRITQAQFLAFLSQENMDINAYSAWITENSKSIFQLEDNRRKTRDRNTKQNLNRELSDHKKRFNLLEFVKQHGKVPEFGKYIQQHKNMEGIKLRGYVDGQVRGQLKDATRRPLIPGSSIKGAIRTALFYHFLNTGVDKKKVIDILNEQLRPIQQEKQSWKLRKVKARFADRLEQLAFYCTETRHGKPSKKANEKFDVLKFLSISDAYTKTTRTRLTMCDIELFVVQNKEAKTQGQTPLVESINAGETLTFQLGFDTRFLFAVASEMKKHQGDYVQQGKEQVWIGLKKKIQAVFGLDITTLTKDNLAKKEQEVIRFILSRIRQFNKAQLEADERWMVNFQQHDRRNNYTQKIKAGFQILDSYSDSHLIRLGYATGFNGITEVLYFAKDEELRAVYKKVLTKFGIGDSPQGPRKRANSNQGPKFYEANLDRFPKSRRWISNYDYISPMGWMVLGGEGLPEVKSTSTTTEVDVERLAAV